MSRRDNVPSIVCIDAGWRNLAFVHICDGDWRHPRNWVREAIAPAKATESEVFDGIYQWATRNQDLLESADVIVLERQLHRRCIIINTVIRTLHHGKCIERNPNSVGKFHQLPLTRERKKKAAVAIVDVNVSIPRYYGGKLDDLADVMLLATEYLFRDFPITRIGWIADVTGEQGQRGKTRRSRDSGGSGGTSAEPRRAKAARIEVELRPWFCEPEPQAAPYQTAATGTATDGTGSRGYAASCPKWGDFSFSSVDLSGSDD